MITLIINGRTVEAEEGTSVLEAAERLGIEIPHFCWHPALRPVGSCRLCQVEFTAPGRPRLGISCRTPVAEGMEVETHSEAAVKARAAVLEFLLANHPLDCPICDKAGECPLQDYTFRHGPDTSRFEEPKRHNVKRAHLGGHIIYDGERCVLCTRCVRFMEDYARAPQLLVRERGDRSTIDIFPDRVLDSNYTGNLADICPVGALTLEEFRFKVRAWNLTAVPSVCPYCSRGCNIYLDVRKHKNRLFRVRPRTRPEVNGYFICNEGRFRPLEAARESHRVLACRAGGREVTREEALAEVVRGIKEGEGPILVVAAARRTVEELFLLSELFGKLEGARRVAAAPDREAPDGILRTGECAANRRALELFGYEILSLEALAGVFAEAKGGRLFMLDAAIDPGEGARAAFDFACFMDYVRSPVAETADVVIPGRAWFEKDGTLINFEDRVQRIRPAVDPPRPEIGDDLQTLSALYRGVHGTAFPLRAEAVFARIAEVHSAFRGLSYDLLGEAGAPLAAAPPEAGEGEPARDETAQAGEEGGRE